MDRVLRNDLDDVERVDETLVLIQLDQQPLLVRVQERHRLTTTQHNTTRTSHHKGGSVAEWLACWTQAQNWAWVEIAVATLSGNSLKQTVHTHRASVHRAAKLVAALLCVAGVTAGLAKSNGSLPPGL